VWGGGGVGAVPRGRAGCREHARDCHVVNKRVACKTATQPHAHLQQIEAAHAVAEHQDLVVLRVVSRPGAQQDLGGRVSSTHTRPGWCVL
jgi:hypothetical protein